MKIDTIAKEELWRSVAVYGIFLIIGFLTVAGTYRTAVLYYSSSIDSTAVHFLLWCDIDEENLTDPTITNIFRHALRQEITEKTTTRRRASLRR